MRGSTILITLAMAVGTPALAEETKTMFRTIDPHMLVSPQIAVADVAAAKAQGVTLIVNNRPDGEDPTAPQGEAIAAAARAAGIAYVAIPVGHGGYSSAQVDAMTDALAHSGGKTLAYCRSGTRSTMLWSLARAKAGDAPDAIAAKAAAAGYDVAPVRTMIDMLASPR